MVDFSAPEELRFRSYKTRVQVSLHRCPFAFFLIVYSKLNLYLWRAVLVKRLRQKIFSQLTRV